MPHQGSYICSQHTATSLEDVARLIHVAFILLLELKERQNTQRPALSQNGQAFAALHVRDLEVDDLLAIIFTYSPRRTMPARMLLQKLPGARMRPINKLVNRWHIIGRNRDSGWKRRRRRNKKTQT